MFDCKWFDFLKQINKTKFITSKEILTSLMGDPSLNQELNNFTGPYICIWLNHRESNYISNELHGEREEGQMEEKKS